jgi:hypothetical protein
MSAIIVPLTNPNQFASVPFLIASLLMLFGSMAIVAGLPGMYARQATRAGWLGFIGFILVFFGLLVAGVGFGFISAIVIPWMTTHAPELIAGEIPPLLEAFVVVAVLMVVIGSIPLGLVTMRAGVLPRWMGLLLIVSGVAGILDLAPLSPFMKNLVATLSGVLFFLGLMWAGYALLTEGRVEEVQAPVVSEGQD